MPIFVLLILFFVLELALFIELGSELGVLATLIEIVISGVIGVQIIRLTGFWLLRDLQSNLHNLTNKWWLQVRRQNLMRRILAAVLLIVPGFATDIVGVVLLIWSLFGRSGGKDKNQYTEQHGPDARPSGRVIEGEYEDASRSRPRDRGPE